MTLFAFVGSLEISLAVAIATVVIAAPILIVLATCKRFRFIPPVGAAALAILTAVGAFLLHDKSAQLPAVALTTDVVLLIDNTRSMGQTDEYSDTGMQERVRTLGEGMRAQLEKDLPGKIQSLEAELKQAGAGDEADALKQRLEHWRRQRDQLAANTWQPSRLQLVQAVLTQDWLAKLVSKRGARVHVFHFDAAGRAVKLSDPNGDASALIEPDDPGRLRRAANAIAQLEPVGNESPLGAALRQVIDHGPSLAAVILFTDGQTTRAETILQAAQYAAERGVALDFVGVGEEPRELWLHDLQAPDRLYRGDRAVFDVRLTSQGFRNLAVPVVLKRKQLDGAEKEIERVLVTLDGPGKPARVRLSDVVKDIGRHNYIIEALAPRLVGDDKPMPPVNPRRERSVEVIGADPTKVLYVEGQPRNEFRFIKNLLERGAKEKTAELTVMLLDADKDWPGKGRNNGADRTALAKFPATLAELEKYDVLILGDCDPGDERLKPHLQNIVRFVRGEDEQGRAVKQGRSVLFMAGALHNPHRFLGTPLAALLPVTPLRPQPPVEIPRVESYRPALTAAGKTHPLFRFDPDEVENQRIWDNLKPMFWHAAEYRLQPIAEVLAVHPTERAFVGPQERHPLVAQMYVGMGRSLFFGFDETWRWRFQDGEPKFNRFWTQTIRYLSRNDPASAEMVLNRQTPYRAGEPIQVTVWLPDRSLKGNALVQVAVAHYTEGRKAPDLQWLRLTKPNGGPGLYRGTLESTKAGKYRFRLAQPDVSGSQPDGDKPRAEAIVYPSPRETDRLPMNAEEMQEAAALTNGAFYNLVEADRVLEK
jgi:hypothetical protein